jgi:uncharacterized protein (DUF58 family)
MQLGELLTAGERDRIKGLELLARQVVEGFCSGQHRSPHKGYSVEFKEHRPYVQGDEIRAIDWKVFGKTDRIYIREFEEETNLKATLIVDASGSMNYFGRRGREPKYRYAMSLAAALAYLMIGQQDAVGLATFDSQIREFLPARSRPSHLQGIFAALQRRAPAGETDLGQVLRALAKKLHRRGLLILISDCFADLQTLQHALSHFRHAKHEVLVFQILDPDEVDFPFSGRMRFRNLERANEQQDVDAIALRQAYRAKFDAYQTQLRDGCGRNRIDHVVMTTDMPLAEGLARYLATRRRLS